MPFTGTLDVTSYDEASLPLVEDLGTTEWRLEDADVLQVMFEIDDDAMVSLIPPALHPTIPPTVLVNATRVADSSVGAFTLAEVRIGCRAATRPRGFLARAYCDSDIAARELASRWGYPVEAADVQLRVSHFDARVTVNLDGGPILEAALIDPEPINGADIQYLANMNLARVRRDGDVVTRLVQVDPEYTFRSANRGIPELTILDDIAWNLPGTEPVYPVSASLAKVDITLPQLRFLANPILPPLQAVERI